jgi:hypothetical protein
MVLTVWAKAAPDASRPKVSRAIRLRASLKVECLRLLSLSLSFPFPPYLEMWNNINVLCSKDMLAAIRIAMS